MTKKGRHFQFWWMKLLSVTSALLQ